MKLKRTLIWSAVVLAGLALEFATWSVLIKPSFAQGAQAVQEQRFPDVVAAKVRASGSGQFDFDVTLSSPYDTPQRYADAFRVSTLDGKVLGERILLHDHQTEQPFTRDLYGVKITADVKKVRIQGRDQKHGYGGKTMEVSLPGR
jgi:hypothetical protein